MQITDTPEVVWQNCSLDIVGPLTQTSENNKYLLTFQDELSKYKSSHCYTTARCYDCCKSFCRGNCSEIWDTPGDTNRLRHQFP
jgi:hypothetical protein